MIASIMRRCRRKAHSCAPDLFTWSRETDLLKVPAVRAVARRVKVSPSLAAVLAELAGLAKDAQHG